MARTVKSITAETGPRSVQLLTKGEILGALPKLGRADLEAVQAMAGHLLGAATAGAEPGAGAVGLLIFDSLVSALGLAMHYSALASDTARRFRNATPTFIKFLDDNFKGWDSNKITQTAFLRMLFGLMVDDLKRRGSNPSVGIVIVNIFRMRGVFNDAFPGYLEAGLGNVILKQYVKTD